MVYLTYSEYSELGGEAVDAFAYTKAERNARRKLDYFTQDRLKNATTITDDVKECMAELIDKMAEMEEGEKVSSFSHDGVSVSFVSDDRTDEEILYDIAVEYLPIELITLAVN